LQRKPRRDFPKLVLKHIWRHVLAGLVQSLAGDITQLVRQAFVAKDDVKEPAKQRQQHNRDDPGDFVRRVLVVGDDEHNHHKAHNVEEDIGVECLLAGEKYKETQQRHLPDDYYPHQEKALKHKGEYGFYHAQGCSIPPQSIKLL